MREEEGVPRTLPEALRTHAPDVASWMEMGLESARDGFLHRDGARAGRCALERPQARRTIPAAAGELEQPLVQFGDVEALPKALHVARLRGHQLVRLTDEEAELVHHPREQRGARAMHAEDENLHEDALP